MKINELYIVGLIATILNASSLIAQNIFSNLPNTNSEKYIAHVRHYSMNEGISDRSIHYTYEDSRGLIWLGTNYGVNRFDGRSFKWYLKERTKLRNNVVINIAEDDEGWLWIHGLPHYNITKNGTIDFINIYTNETTSFEERFEKQSLPFDAKTLVHFFQFDNKKIGILVDKRKVYCYENKKFTLIKTFDKEVIVSQIFPLQRKGCFWTVLIKGENAILAKIDKNGKINRQHIFKKNRKIVYLGGTETGKTYFKIYKGKSETNKFIYDVFAENDEGKLDVIPISDSLKFVFAYHKKYDFFLRINTNRTLEGIDTKTGQVIDFQGETKVDGGFVRGVWDKNENYWGATREILKSIHIKSNPFYSLPKNRSALNFRGITKSKKGGLFVNYADEFRYYTNKEETTPKVFLKIKHPVKTLEDKRNHLWIGSCYGTFRYDYTKDSLQEFKVWRGEVWSLYEDEEDGRIWHGTSHALEYADEESFKMIQAPKPDSTTLTFVYDIQRAGKGKLWVATGQGLYIYNKEKEIYEAKYWSKSKPPYYLPADDFHHLHFDKDSVVWLATGDAGLIRWNRKTNESKRYSTAEGLVSNVIHAVYSDDYGFLWISTENGIAQFNKSTETFKFYRVTDGIPHNEFNRSSHFKDEDGIIYFGSVVSVVIFHPRDFYRNNLDELPDPPLIITDFEQYTNKKDTLENKLSEILKEDKIVLQPNDRFFKITFTLTDYLENEKIKYVYQVEGYDKTWTVTRENAIQISGLPYGKFTLVVKGQLPNGQFSKNELRIPVYVLRPFYLKWWFALLSIVVVVMFIYVGVRWRLNQLENQKIELEQQVNNRTKTIRKQNALLQKQTKELKALNATKNRFFGIIAHDLRGPLIALKGTAQNMAYLLRKNRLKQAQQMGENITDATQHVNNLLDNLLNWALLQTNSIAYHPKSSDMVAIIKETKQLFNHITKAKNVSLEIETPPKLYAYVDADAIATVLRNLVSNALKFTEEGGCIRIKGWAVANKVMIQVKDTGIGILSDKLAVIFDFNDKKSTRGTAGEKGTGLGLVLCKELIEQNKGQIFIESKLREGTIISFELPITEIKSS